VVFASQSQQAAQPRHAKPAIEVVNLRKSYGDTQVLHDLTLSVGQGEIFGFLGPNGAGKTTTMKILTGLVRPSAGEARIFGLDPSGPEARQRLGYLPEQFRFHGWQTGEEVLMLHGRLAGLSESEVRKRIAPALHRVGLEGRGGERVQQYSKGMTQRLGIAQAIIHRPGVVLLDEPTSALDPVGRREIRDLVRGLAQEDVTVFINSHLLTEIEMVCDRVAIVDKGRVVKLGGMSQLLGGINELRITVNHVDLTLLTLLGTYGSVTRSTETTVTMDLTKPDLSAQIAQEIVTAGYALSALVPVQRSLEDLFISLVESGDR
jgi:ABC-2 type transport system ATP-binding protein